MGSTGIPSILAAKPFRRSVILAAATVIVLGGMLIAYAVFAPTNAPPELQAEVRREMVIGAVVATFCLMPASLFLIRTIQWWLARGPHPSVALTLLATLTIFPIILSLLIIFTA